MSPLEPADVDSEDDHGGEAAVVVKLTVGNDQSALDAAFRLEEGLEGRLEQTGTGYVDGNEIGGGVFEIFVYGPRLDGLRQVIVPLVRERWQRPGTVIKLLEGGREVGSLRFWLAVVKLQRCRRVLLTLELRSLAR